MPKISKLYNEKLLKEYVVVSICRQDLINAGYEEKAVMDLTEEDMNWIADKMYIGFDYLVSINYVCDNLMNLKRSNKKNN